VDRILNNRNELSAIGRSASGGKDLMKKTFSRPHPLSPSPQMWRGGTKGGEVKKPNFALCGKIKSQDTEFVSIYSYLCICTFHAIGRSASGGHVDFSN
jgi:hypothetical protein